MSQIKISFSILAIFFLACSTPKKSKQLNVSPPVTKSDADFLQSFVDSLVDKGIPSLAVAVIQPKIIQYSIGGKSKILGGTEVNLNSKYHLGSNSKAITTFIALKLVQEGVLDLDMPLSAVYKDSSFLASAYADITLEQLLSHTARIQPFTSGIEFMAIPKLEGPINEKRIEFASKVFELKPINSEKEYDYSNAGYVLAAMILELKTGKTFEALLEETFAEIGLDHFNGFPNKENIEYPWGHWMQGKELAALAPDAVYKLEDYMLPAGDISMNIEDYSKFIQMNLNGLLGEDNYLNSENYYLAHFGKEKYSYGWGNYELEGRTESTHDGSVGTFYCHTVVSPGCRIAISIMMNSALEDHVNAIYELRERLIDEFKMCN